MATLLKPHMRYDDYRNAVLGRVELVHSVTTGGSGATATSTALVGLAQTEDIAVSIITSGSAGAVGSLNVFVDSRVDGTNWVNIGRSAVITTNLTLIQHYAKVQTNGEVNVTADAGAGTIRSVSYGDDVRIRTTITGTATTSINATVYVSVMR